MTTRNFRVHNGISVGDIVIDASANTITGGATAAPSADGQFSNKKYVDDSIAAISTTAINQGNSNVTVTDSGTGAITISADGTESGNSAASGNNNHCHRCDQPFTRNRRCDPCQQGYNIWYR